MPQQSKYLSMDPSAGLAPEASKQYLSTDPDAIDIDPMSMQGLSRRRFDPGASLARNPENERNAKALANDVLWPTALGGIGGGLALKGLQFGGRMLAKPLIEKTVQTGILDAAGSPITRTVTEQGASRLSQALPKFKSAAKTAAPIAAGALGGNMLGSTITKLLSMFGGGK